VTNEELHNYVLIPKYQADQVKETKVGRSMWYATQSRKKCVFFGGKAQKKKRPFGRTRCQWENGGREGWIQLAQNRNWWQALVNTVIRLSFWYHRLSQSVSQLANNDAVMITSEETPNN
jgi:hypothetical protein